jgi:hypothetical protein
VACERTTSTSPQLGVDSTPLRQNVSAGELSLQQKPIGWTLQRYTVMLLKGSYVGLCCHSTSNVQLFVWTILVTVTWIM